MKKSLLTLLACAAGLMAQAQVVKVLSVEQVPTGDAVSVNEPRISPDGKFAIVSTNTDNSLLRIDLASGNATKVTDNGSAHNLTFSPDGQQIVFTRSTVNENRLRYHSVESINLADGAATTLVAPNRHLGRFAMSTDGNLTVVAEGRISARNLRGKNAAETSPVVATNHGHLELTRADGTKVNLDPQGHGSYLWPTLSPDGTKVAYYLAGAGCFVCNIDGSDVRALGYIHAPAWLGNDVVVGCQDHDNGKFITSSAIVAADLAGTIQVIADESLLGLSPSVNADGSRVLFSSANGKLYVINLEK